MELIDVRNLNDLTESREMQLGDATIYIPLCYCNPIAYLKKNCVLWLPINNNGVCNVYKITNEATWTEEMLEIISLLD